MNVLTGSTKLLATFNVGGGVAGYMWGSPGNGATSVGGDELDSQDNMGGFVGITQSLTDTLRAGVYYGCIDAENAAGESNNLSTIHANVFFNPVPQVTVGLEYIFGQRDVNDVDGDASQVQLGVQYSF